MIGSTRGIGGASGPWTKSSRCAVGLGVSFVTPPPIARTRRLTFRGGANTLRVTRDNVYLSTHSAMWNHVGRSRNTSILNPRPDSRRPVMGTPCSRANFGSHSVALMFHSELSGIGSGGGHPPCFAGVRW